MADQKITELPIKNASAINLADYLLGIDAADGYQMLISDLAKKIVETYAGSSLAGSAQTLKAAIDALNGNIGAYYQCDSTTVNVPSGTALNTVVASLTLPAGRYVVYGKALYASNSSGDRLISISHDQNISPNDFNVQNAVSMARTGMTIIRLENLVAETTLRVIARQNSGEVLETMGQLIALRLK